MRRCLIPVILLVGFAFVASPAQDFKKDEKKAAIKAVEPAKKATVGVGNKNLRAPADTGEVEVHFLNGSTVRMLIQSESLEVATLYGKLSVPIKHVRAVEFGLHYPPGIEAKVAAAVKQLGSGDYREREKAGKSLVDFGPLAYPIVLEASRATDVETSRRAKEIVQKLQANHAKKDLKTATDDKVVTPTFTIVGRILTPSLKANTEYFGTVELSIAKMRKLRTIAGPSRDLELALDAAKYANPGRWMETKYEVDGKSTIVITAKGLIDTWPQQPGQYMMGPNGISNRGGIINGRVIMGGGGFGGGFGAGVAGRKVAGPITGQNYGAILLGKVGENGDPFIIGDSFEGAIDTEGKLFLHIGPSPWNCESAGSYDVKISRKE